MQSLRGSLAGRVRWVVAFVLLLLVATATPVLADPSGEGSEESPSAAEVPAPSASELAEAELEQREHVEWLSSPEAEHQREASSNAYTSLTAGEAQSLLLEAFPAQLKQLNGDPARVLSELEIEKPLGAYGALVSDEEGESAILNSSVPVQSEVGGEGKKPVDLTLERSGSSFVPQNPITEVELPGSAEEPIQLQSGIEVELPTSDDHGAEPLGDMNLFYPETETATDTLVAPKAGGVEVFEQLRSPESPERFSFALNLPNEATLRPSEAGGAGIVTSSGKTIGEVRPPSATDAQGATVPVTTSIEGDSLVLEVSHRSREVAYPVLLDPEWVTDTTSFGEWTPSLNSGYEYYLNNNWSSLDAISRGHYYYPAYTHGQWAWGAYGATAYIAAATFSPVDYIVHTCQTYEPHGYIGLYNPGSGNYDALGIWATWSSEGPYETGWKGNTGTRDAIIGIGTSGAGVEIGCAHELYVGGYSIQEKDPEAPTINSVGGTSANWLKEITVTPHVSDPGLGVKAITLSPEGSSPHTNSQGCTGANGSRCPGSWETSFGVSYFAEGERSASVTAYDPLGPDVKAHVSSSYTWTTRLDRQKPEVELEGEFTEALEEAEEEGEGKKAPALHLPVYNLKIEATDKANEGNPKTEPKARRSGLKNIAVFLDGKAMKVPWEAQGCSGPEYSCPMNKTYPVPMEEVQGGGVHHLKVIATDQVGNEREREIEFEYFPATGMKDEYVMQHFPLPDGEGNESEEEHPIRPELAVNVTNGNLVYRQKDVEVTGPAVDLEVERDYNSQLPEGDNTQWGDGWTLAQTPKLEPEETKGEAPPAKASMVRTSGVLESTVGLPTESGGTQFDKKLQAVVTKEPGGGYEVEDQSGETDTSLAFDKAGKVKELQTPGYAKIDYSYEEGDLSEMAVEDPATAPAPKQEAEVPTYQSSFGTEGTGVSQFKHPADLAIDAKRNIWVADKENNRIEEFDGAGAFVKTFGWGVTNGEAKLQVCTASCLAGKSGSGNGQFNKPTAIAVDPEGNIWVADWENCRIERFNPAGEYLSKFGTCGSESGKFYLPEGLAVDSAGNVYVASSLAGSLSRVQKFNAKGEFLKLIASQGEAAGQVKAPAGLAFDSAGNLWVADRNNNRVEEFSAAGEYVRQWKGSGSAAFKPYAIGVDSAGTVWVGDTEHNRVEAFNQYGDLLSAFGSEGSGEGQFKLGAPVGLVADPSGEIWIADGSNNRVQRWLASPNVKYALSYQSSFGTEGTGVSQFKHPADLAIDAKRNIWVADKENNRIEEFDGAGAFVKTFGWGVTNGEAKLQVCTASCLAGKSGSGNGQFNKPTAIAVDPEGNIWVADWENCRIERFNPAGEYLSKFGTCGSESGKFYLPEGLAVDSAGNVYVASSLAGSLSRVQKFNAKGEFLKLIASQGEAAGQVKAPAGLAFDSAGNLWVADRNNNRVEEFSAAGEYVRQWKGSGSAAFKPYAIGVDSAGTVWVGDTEHNRVEGFNQYGDLLSAFGAEGSGEGQFKLGAPVGLVADPSGEIWIADGSNNRVQRWLASPNVKYALSYQSSFGTEGTGNGQFKHPADLAIDAKRNIWVADKENNRIEEFDGAGAFVKTFGWGVTNGEAKLQVCTASCRAGLSGSGTGELKQPTAIAVDPEGDIWVAEKENCRIERFTPAGEYLSKVGGTCGSESGKFYYPEGLAIDSAGNVYVASSIIGGASRVQKFNAKGEFLKLIASEGAGNGQVQVPTGLAVDSSGDLWVADRNNNRVEEFSAAGEYVRQWKGSGSAAFKPYAIGVDSSGTVWVGDTEHNRVEGFNQYGDLLSAFGAEGSGEGQFKLGAPVGLVADLIGDVWVTDSTNQRVEQWIPSKDEPPAPQEGDPNVEVNVSSGLVTSVEGEEAGKTTYSHTGELLTTVNGPKGKANYEYDEAKRLKKVSLPNGTWGEVKYDSYGRVESVTVSVEGAKAKKTTFTYKDEPRRTTVSPEGEPATIYDIAPDGSVLKSWNTAVAPEIENLSGSLYANKETEKPIEPGDYELLVQAFAAEGIASIQVVANGSQLVDEKTCTKTAETNCKTVEDPWVTNTGNWPPGILQLEVIVTDANHNTESVKFWVNIPYTPPPNPEAEEPPKFEEVLHFREEFGLDLDLKGNEIAIDERIFNLIGDWNNPHTPAGEVARATDERWGVPLRAVDAAELEYREQYLAHDVPQLDEWARANLSGTYAGAYVDERSGGLIRLGFTANQTSSIALAKQGAGLIAPDRVAGFSSVPTHSLEALQSVENEVNSAIPSLPAGLIVSSGIDTEANSVAVGATNVEEASVDLKNILGQQAPILVEFEEGAPVEMSTRAKISGPILAGDYLLTPTGGTCSAGYGAFQKLSTGIKRLFLLTAAHCSKVGENMRRENSAGKKASIGVTKRSGKDPELGELIADGEAVALNGTLGAPRYINQGRGPSIAVKSIATVPKAGQHLCHAGYGSDPLGNAHKPLCGKVRNGRYFVLNKSPKKVEVLFCFEAGSHGGDSGGPVWIQGSHTAVGLATNGRGNLGKESYRETCATALLPSVVEGKSPMSPDAAILSNSKLTPLQMTYAP